MTRLLPAFLAPVVLVTLFSARIGWAAEAPATVGIKSVAELRDRIEAHVTQPRFRASLWAVRIDSLETGKTLYSHHADRLMTPASNSKLYVGALALDMLGPDYRMVTPLLATAKPDDAGTVRGDVIVSGRGDPSWKSAPRRSDFWRIFTPFVESLQRAGVRRITGEVVADATYFHALPNGTGWMVDDLDTDDGAEISAVSLEDNYADVRITPGARPGDPCGVELLHPFTNLVLDNRMVTVAADGGRQVVNRRLFGENVVHLFGWLPIDGKEAIVKVTVPRPAGWFARALKAALIRGGIPVDGGARSLRWPDEPAASATAVKLGEVTSPPLRELVAAFMKPSQNLETDLIFAHLGEARRTAETPAWRESEALALEGLRNFFQQHGLPSEDVRFAEGSGLSQYNLTTANATVALLATMAKQQAARDFLDSLPVAGADGTLQRRMKGTAAEGNVRAKTGTLRYTNSLSGYVTTVAGERLVFSLMLNRNAGQPANRPVVRELDDIAVWLAGLSERSGD